MRFSLFISLRSFLKEKENGWNFLWESCMTIQNKNIHAHTYTIYLNGLNWNIFEKHFPTNSSSLSEKASELKRNNKSSIQIFTSDN